MEAKRKTRAKLSSLVSRSEPGTCLGLVRLSARKEKEKKEKCIFRIEILFPIFAARFAPSLIVVRRDRSRSRAINPSRSVTPALYPFLLFYEFDDTVSTTD